MTHTTPDLSASNSLPAVPMGKDVKIRERIDVPQREDYVPPVPKFSDFIEVDTPMLMAAQKFIEINAVFPEHHDLAGGLRQMLEGRS